MKVTTVACIQGAWLPDFFPANVLDIGAGTGILSLMAAQRYACPIDAVEIEHNAFYQLKDNIDSNPWNERIQGYHMDIKAFAKQSSKKYDLIISNPPFYQNQLKSLNDRINQAKHETSLTVSELLDVSSFLLSESGKISILLPLTESNQLSTIIPDKGLFFVDQLVISDTIGKTAIAAVTILSKTYKKPVEKKLIIKNENGSYTTDFISLVKDYYLYM